MTPGLESKMEVAGERRSGDMVLRRRSTIGLGRPVLRLRLDHVGLRGWSGPDRGELIGELTAIDRGDRRDDGTHRTSASTHRRALLQKRP